MKKVLGFAMLSLALISSSCKKSELKDVLELVSAETVTVSAKGGETIIEVNSNSALTADSSEEWVNVEVVDNNNVKATVDAYEGDVVRTANITISNQGGSAPVKVRINQAAVVYDFTPADYEFEAEGGQYSFAYTADAALTAVAEEDADWLEIEVTATDLVFKAEPNASVKTRSADVEWTIATAKGTFTVSQKGAEATLESENFSDGNFDAVNASVNGTSVVYEYTTNSELEVSSEQDWIETYTEDGKFYINVLANNGDAREGTVAWSVKGSSTLKGEVAVNQKGSILKIDAYPYDYSASYTSANTFIVVVTTKNCTDVRMKLYTTASVEGKNYDELLQMGKAANTVVDENFTMDRFNQATGYGIISPVSSLPDNKIIAVVVYATDDDSEQVSVSYVHFSNGDQKRTYTLEDLRSVNNKSDYYGNYHAFFNVTDQTTSDFQGIMAQGNINITDGESALDNSGNVVELLKISGLWNTQFNARVTFDDTMYYHYINGLIYSIDQELGDFYVDGELYSEGNMCTLTAMSDDKLYDFQRVLAGGIINDEGYIAFVPNDNEDDSISYVSTWLVDESGYWCIAKDFILIPTGEPVDQIKVAAAYNKLAKIKTAMKSMTGNGTYVERNDSRFSRALKQINAEERAFLGRVMNLN